MIKKYRGDKMIIYVAHPYGGQKENKEKIEKYINQLVERYPNYTFVSPIHTFGFMYNVVKTYEQGMKMCLNLLRKCDGLILCQNWEKSAGCNREYNFAKDRNMEIFLYEEVYEKWPFEVKV